MLLFNKNFLNKIYVKETRLYLKPKCNIILQKEKKILLNLAC